MLFYFNILLFADYLLYLARAKTRQPRQHITVECRRTAVNKAITITTDFHVELGKSNEHFNCKASTYSLFIKISEIRIVLHIKQAQTRWNRPEYDIAKFENESYPVACCS